MRLLEPTFGAAIVVSDLLRLVADDDVGACRIVSDAGRAVGRVLADLINHLNPAAIVVGGELSAAGSPLLDGIRESIDRHALPSAAQTVEVRPGLLGERAEVLGALALVIGDTDRLRSGDLPGLRRVGAAQTESPPTTSKQGHALQATEGGDRPKRVPTALATRD